MYTAPGHNIIKPGDCETRCFRELPCVVGLEGKESLNLRDQAMEANLYSNEMSD